MPARVGVSAASTPPAPGDRSERRTGEGRRSRCPPRPGGPARLFLPVLVVALAGAACSSGTASSGTTGQDVVEPDVSGPADAGAPRSEAPAPFTVEQVAPSPREAVVAALEISEIPDIPTTIRFEDPSFGPPAVVSGDLRPGGPPPDGIPAIDEPRFHHVDDVDFLTEREPVFALEIDGDARAYPLQVLTWHEIVNDTVAGIPVAVTYCPLCNSAFAYGRRHGGRVLDFGVSGALWHSSLVMYDRQTRSLWSHFTGEGLLGVLAGVRLDAFPVALASWAEFAAAHPDGLVLSRDTGFDRDYGRNPYPGYDDVANPPFLYDGEVDGRYAAKTRVVGVELGGAAFAVTADRLVADRVVPFDAAGRPLVAWWQPGTSSALDASTVAGGRDVGTSAVLDRRVDGEALTFEPLPGGGFRDAETGTRWRVFGEATEGPLRGQRLEAVPHVDTFWFAWSAFRPATTVIG